MITKEGRCGISATIVEDSINNWGNRLTTFQLTYPRFIHSELMTHRVFSRNASSSRAIPVEKVIGQVLDDPAMPVFWGSNKPGMQAGSELEGSDLNHVITTWTDAALQATGVADALMRLGLHKQIANRVLEPWQFMKTIVTATEWKNWYMLRDHDDAQPEIRELAMVMRQAHAVHTPVFMEDSHEQWHMPYVTLEEANDHWIKDLCMVSSARCARVSYKNHDQSDPEVQKDTQLAMKLLGSKHMSPFEHIATPMESTDKHWVRQKGVTHIDSDGRLWSGNLQGWIQFRQLI